MSPLGNPADLLGVGGCEAGEDVLSHVLSRLVRVADAAGQLWQSHQPDIQRQLLHQPLHHSLHVRLGSPLLHPASLVTTGVCSAKFGVGMRKCRTLEERSCITHGKALRELSLRGNAKNLVTMRGATCVGQVSDQMSSFELWKWDLPFQPNTPAECVYEFEPFSLNLLDRHEVNLLHLPRQSSVYAPVWWA